MIRLCLLLYYSMLQISAFNIIKVIGSQWLWLFFSIENICIYQVILLESDFFIGDLRLIQSGNLIVLLTLIIYKIWLSSIDVIHSFTIPVLSIKLDAIPGRCNEVVVNVNISGSFYGQCSELCGVLHGFMPISICFL